MNNGGAKRFVARLIEEGMQISWLRALKSGARPSRESGLSRGSIRDLHSRGALKKMAKDNQGISHWAAGPFLQDYIDLAERLVARQ